MMTAEQLNSRHGEVINSEVARITHVVETIFGEAYGLKDRGLHLADSSYRVWNMIRDVFPPSDSDTTLPYFKDTKPENRAKHVANIFIVGEELLSALHGADRPETLIREMTGWVVSRKPYGKRLKHFPGLETIITQAAHTMHDAHAITNLYGGNQKYRERLWGSPQTAVAETRKKNFVISLVLTHNLLTHLYDYSPYFFDQPTVETVDNQVRTITRLANILSVHNNYAIELEGKRTELTDMIDETVQVTFNYQSAAKLLVAYEQALESKDPQINPNDHRLDKFNLDQAGIRQHYSLDEMMAAMAHDQWAIEQLENNNTVTLEYQLSQFFGKKRVFKTDNGKRVGDPRYRPFPALQKGDQQQAMRAAVSMQTALREHIRSFNNTLEVVNFFESIIKESGVIAPIQDKTRMKAVDELARVRHATILMFTVLRSQELEMTDPKLGKAIHSFDTVPLEKRRNDWKAVGFSAAVELAAFVKVGATKKYPVTVADPAVAQFLQDLALEITQTSTLNKS